MSHFVHFTTDDGLIVEAKECGNLEVSPWFDVSTVIYDPKKKNAIVYDGMLAYNKDGLTFETAVQTMFIGLLADMRKKKLWKKEKCDVVYAEMNSRMIERTSQSK